MPPNRGTDQTPSAKRRFRYQSIRRAKSHHNQSNEILIDFAIDSFHLLGRRKIDWSVRVICDSVHSSRNCACACYCSKALADS